MNRFLILGALLCATTTVVHADPAYDQFSEASRKAYNAGNLAEAAEQAEEALSLAAKPDQKVSQLRRLALIAVQSKQPDEARQWLEQAQSQVPIVLNSPQTTDESKVEMLVGLAQVYRELGNSEKALGFLQQVEGLKGAPIDAVQQAKLGVAGILVAGKRFAEARALLQDLIAAPDIAKGLYSLARLASAGSYLNERKDDEALVRLASVADDERVDLKTRSYTQLTRANVFKRQQKYEDALNTYQDAFTLYDEAAKTEPEIRAREAAVFKGYMESYVKLNDNKGVTEQAMRLYAPVAAKVEVYNKAYNYQAALPYYQAMQGLNDYVPFEIMLATKTGLGVALMYGKDWDEARKLFDVAAKLKMSDGVQGQQRQNIAILQQNAQRLTAYSYLLQGQTQGGEIEFAKARELYDKLMATPDLNAATRVQAEKNIVELEKFEK